MAFSMKSASTRTISSSTYYYYNYYDLYTRAKGASLFHSTPALDRKRRSNFWDSNGGSYRASPKKSYNYSRRSRKLHSRHTLLRNVSEFAEHLFQSWQHGEECNDPSWFREQDWVKGKKRNKSSSKGPEWGNYRNRGGFHFCNGDDEDVEEIFRSAFGCDRSTYWSFINDSDCSSQWSSCYTNNRKSSWRWSKRYEEEYETYEEYNDSSESDLVSDRLALGLSASGPLKLEDVKHAYRVCALKWHPDRHQGSSKADAEEKFKHCSAAYQSLCDKME